MLSNLFHYDNPVWRFIGKFFDVMVLNLLWVICSIPIVTVGASTTAVYYVTMKLVRDENDSVVKAFFRSFKENFKQATVIWLILLLSGALIGFDIYFFLHIQTAQSAVRTVMMALLFAFAILWVLISLYAFPLQAKFYNQIRRTLFNGFFMSVRHILQSLVMLVTDAAIVVIALLVPMLFMLLVLFGFPLLAFFNSYIFVWIFDKYIPKKESAQEEGDFWELPEENS